MLHQTSFCSFLLVRPTCYNESEGVWHVVREICHLSMVTQRLFSQRILI